MRTAIATTVKIGLGLERSGSSGGVSSGAMVRREAVYPLSSE